MGIIIGNHGESEDTKNEKIFSRQMSLFDLLSNGMKKKSSCRMRNKLLSFKIFSFLVDF